jgi:hypothetical protein
MLGLKVDCHVLPHAMLRVHEASNPSNHQASKYKYAISLRMNQTQLKLKASFFKCGHLGTAKYYCSVPCELGKSMKI